MPCIMPEMPYCPACKFGFIARTNDMPDTDCNWICLCTQADYTKHLEEAMED